jgi:hypothetical protein
MRHSLPDTGLDQDKTADASPNCERSRTVPTDVAANHERLEELVSEYLDADVPFHERAQVEAWRESVRTWGHPVDASFVAVLLEGTEAVKGGVRGEKVTPSSDANADREWLERAVITGDSVYDSLSMFSGFKPAPETSVDEYGRVLEYAARELEAALNGIAPIRSGAPALQYESLPDECAGHYTDGDRQITINVNYLDDKLFREAVATMIHEKVHDNQRMQKSGGSWTPPALAKDVAARSENLEPGNYIEDGPGYGTQPVEVDAYSIEALAMLRVALRAGQRDLHYPYRRTRRRPISDG